MNNTVTASTRARTLLGATALTGLLLAAACGDSRGSASRPTAATLLPGSTGNGGTKPPVSVTSTGRVTDQRGAPVPGAVLELDALDGQPNAAIESLRRTDADGRYQLAIAPGRWTLSISADGFKVEKVHLDVPAQGTLVRDVALTPA